MDVEFSFAAPCGAEPKGRLSVFEAKQNERQSYCEIRLESAGEDLEELLADCARRFDAFRLQSYIASLNMASESFAFACEAFGRQGYVFTGLSPADGPRALFCRSPHLPQAPGGFALLPSFTAALEKVKLVQNVFND
jgi:hypothetical protein